MGFFEIFLHILPSRRTKFHVNWEQLICSNRELQVCRSNAIHSITGTWLPFLYHLARAGVGGQACRCFSHVPIFCLLLLQKAVGRSLMLSFWARLRLRGERNGSVPKPGIGIIQGKEMGKQPPALGSGLDFYCTHLNQAHRAHLMGEKCLSSEY